MLFKITIELSIEKSEQKKMLSDIMQKFADFFDDYKLTKLNGIDIEFIKMDNEE